MIDSGMEVCEGIVQGLQQKRLKRKDDEWTEKFNIIQGRIEVCLFFVNFVIFFVKINCFKADLRFFKSE